MSAISLYAESLIHRLETPADQALKVADEVVVDIIDCVTAFLSDADFTKFDSYTAGILAEQIKTIASTKLNKAKELNSKQWLPLVTSHLDEKLKAITPVPAPLSAYDKALAFSLKYPICPPPGDNLFRTIVDEFGIRYDRQWRDRWLSGSILCLMGVHSEKWVGSPINGQYGDICVSKVNASAPIKEWCNGLVTK